jgi:hypothetical protein
MFGESRRVTILVVLGVLAALLIFAYAIWMLVAERNTARETSMLTGSETTVYVNPGDYPGWNPPQDPNQAPPAPDASGSGSSGSTGGGLVPTWLSSGSGSAGNLPAGYSERDLSPDFRKVRITAVKRVDTTRYPNDAQIITIKENIGSGDAAVNLTGMRVQSNSETFLIPRAAKVYKTSGAGLTNVALANGQSALIISSASPVNANFMGNRCMGYLNARYTFKPKLIGTCERPTKGEIATFSGACQEYILRMGSCEEGNSGDSRIPASDSSCRAFVSKINYEGCVERNQASADFLTNVWNVWSGRDLLDPLHDGILLLDASGKLVDWYVY